MIMNLFIDHIKAHKIALIAMSSRIISAIGWLLGMWLVIKYLNPAETGYYYAFQSLVALQVLLEMGMSTVIIVSAGHEVSALSWSNDNWQGSDQHLQRLGSIARLARKWYGLAGLAVIVLITPLGVIFFSSQHNTQYPVAWLGPWIALGISAALSVSMVGLDAITEGMGAVHELALAKLFQSTLAIFAFILALRMGAGLWSSAIMVGIRVLIGSSIIFIKCGDRLMKALRAPRGKEIDWRKELFPFQWRIALSWMAGYMIFQVLTPIVFTYSGAIEAGRFGVAVQATTGVGTIAGAWLQVRQTFWAQGAARKDWKYLERDFKRVSLAMTGFAIIGCMFLAILLLLSKYTSISNRLPGWSVFLAFSTAICINQYIYAMATYLRSFLVEPFLKVSLAMAATVSGGAILLRHQSPHVLAWWYCLATALVGLGIGRLIFRRWQGMNQT